MALGSQESKQFSKAYATIKIYRDIIETYKTPSAESKRNAWESRRSPTAGEKCGISCRTKGVEDVRAASNWEFHNDSDVVETLVVNSEVDTARLDHVPPLSTSREFEPLL